MIYYWNAKTKTAEKYSKYPLKDVSAKQIIDWAEGLKTNKDNQSQGPINIASAKSKDHFQESAKRHMSRIQLSMLEDL